MTNGSIDYILGQINAKLESNEQFHKELKEMLKAIEDKLDTTCADVTALKAKAGTWGAVAGMIAGFIGPILSTLFGLTVLRR